jgi:hypothetical protein
MTARHPDVPNLIWTIIVKNNLSQIVRFKTASARQPKLMIHSSLLLNP